nr:ribonuclease H-like domain-containing protein [Tanacetum cinerariifolium]
HFNLFSVSQICDKKNRVLFTDTDCLVLTDEFPLPDESQVVLRIPRQRDLYTFIILDLQPEQSITWKADEGYLVGYASNSKAYRVYNLTSKRVEESLNLRFMEDKPNVQGIAERYGYLFSQETADILSQAEADISKNGVSAALDSDGKVLFAGGISAGSDSAGSSSASGYPAGSVPAGGEKPAGSTEPAGSIPATSTSVSADSIPVYAEATTLSPGQSLGSSKNTTRFPVPSDVCKDQLSSGI